MKSINWGPKPFRIFNVWLQQDSLLKSLKDNLKLEEDGNIVDMQNMLKKVKMQIIKWNKEINGSIFQKIERNEERLSLAEEENKVRDFLNNIKEKMEDLYLVRDKMLGQKAGIQWLKEGDRNAKFFHQVIQRRRARNKISIIKFQGVECVTPDRIKDAFFQHYLNFFKKKQGNLLFKFGNLFKNKLSDQEKVHFDRNFLES